MIITCEECSTRFTLDDALVKPEGSKVRCGQCKHVFTAFPPERDLPAFDAAAAELETEDRDESGDIPFDEPHETEDGDLDFEPADGLDFGDQDDDLDFDDQDIDFDEIEFEDAPDMVEPGVSQPEDTAGLELEIEETAESDEDSDGDLDFDTGDDLDLADTDLALEDPEFEASDLEFQEDDLSLDVQDDLEFEDIQPIEEADESTPDRPGDDEAADIEISFDQDDGGLELDVMPVKPEEEDIPDNDLEEISFDDGDSDLELVFDEAPDADLVFEEADDEAPSPEIETDLDDDLTPDPTAPVSDAEPDLTLEEDEEEPAPALSNLADPGEDPDAEKFSGYDQVLEQDTEPEVSLAGEPEEEIPYEPEPEIEVEDTPEETPQPEAALIEPQTAADARKKRAKKSAVGAPVKIFFLLFLLVIAAYVASLKMGADIPFLSQINIPYVTDMLKPAPEAKAQPKPVPNEASINGRFVSNTTAGELFIVTGRIENPSETTYSHIKVKGTLLTKDKAKAGTQTAYCGNIISEETLKTGNILDINRQMTVKQGLRNTNVNIKPGGSVMFMIVFSELPENLTNFTVEVVDFEVQNGK